MAMVNHHQVLLKKIQDNQKEIKEKIKKNEEKLNENILKMENELKILKQRTNIIKMENGQSLQEYLFYKKQRENLE